MQTTFYHDNNKGGQVKIRLPPEFKRGWHLCGAGPARFGYAWRHPCSFEWLAKTKEEAINAAKEKGLI